MAQAFIARALQRGLAKLGEASTLQGVACGKVNIERNVEVFAGSNERADDSQVVRRDVASILGSYNPKVGQTLVHPDGTFRLDRKLDDNGVVRRFVVVAA